jgi:hypothetical protein
MINYDFYSWLNLILAFFLKNRSSAGMMFVQAARIQSIPRLSSNEASACLRCRESLLSAITQSQR